MRKLLALAFVVVTCQPIYADSTSTAGGGGVSASAPVFTGPAVFASGSSCTIGGFRFDNDTDSGIYSPSAGTINICGNNNVRHQFGPGGFYTNIDGMGIGSSPAAPDTFWRREAAGIFGAAGVVTAGSTSQGLRLYNSRDSAGTNYERVAMTWTSNQFNITSEALGTGTVRSIAFGNPVLHADGTNTEPAISFSGDSDTGFYRSASALWNETYNGTRIAAHASTQVGYITNYQIGWYSSGFAAFDTGLTRNGVAGVIRCTDGGTGIRCLQGGGTAVASAGALPLPTGRVFHVTGTTNVTSITSTNFQAGVCITLIFDGVLTFTDGSNLVLATNFVTSADDTISLCYDGTNWYETSRSVN